IISRCTPSMASLPCYVDRRALPSFPTRRSSDLRVHHGGRVGIDEQDVVGREPVALDGAHAGRQRVGLAQVRPREYISAMTRKASSSAGVPAWTTWTGPLVGASIRRVDQGMRTSLTRSISAQRHARGV